MKALPERGRHFLFAPREIRAADRADEHGVASEDKPRSFRAPAVRHEQAEAVLRVSRRVQNLNARIACIDHLLVEYRSEREGGLADVGLVQRVFGAAQFGKRSPTGQVVGMYMRIENIGDRNIQPAGLVDVPGFVSRQHVDSDSLALPAAAEEVRDRGVIICSLFEKHRTLHIVQHSNDHWNIIDVCHPCKTESPKRLTLADEMLTLLPMTTNRTIKDALYEQVARIAKAAASPKRLELIELLGQSPKTVEALAQEAGISGKLVSAHLKELKSARLVEAERHGKYIIYRLASGEVGQLWVMLRVLAEDRLFELQDALRQLSAATHEWVGNSRAELLNKAKSGEVIVIDVRPGEEYQAGHLPFARSMPLAELKNRLAELPKDRPVIAYCRGPFCLMSSDAVRLLRGQGIDALQMREGVVEWNS